MSSPTQQSFFDILKLANVQKEDVLYVGDSGVDMQTATNAGVTACGVTWGFRPRTELEEFNPVYITDAAEKIKKIGSLITIKETLHNIVDSAKMEDFI